MNIGIKDVLNRVNAFFILYLILLTVCFIIKLLYTREEIYFAVNGAYSATGDTFFKYFTNVGDGLVTVAIAVILLLFNNLKI
ncbi:MAG: hypothetical protein EOP54_25025 [Sphingobacteriales bacterium]|nr:MAG: hypothetical protein EOP54_25025 [Sphingobacteriales bacterium]